LTEEVREYFTPKIPMKNGIEHQIEMLIGTYFWVLEIKELGETRKRILNLIRK
jgi:hypothetical protein